jgi:hypothetical protein
MIAPREHADFEQRIAQVLGLGSIQSSYTDVLHPDSSVIGHAWIRQLWWAYLDDPAVGQLVLIGCIDFEAYLNQPDKVVLFLMPLTPSAVPHHRWLDEGTDPVRSILQSINLLQPSTVSTTDASTPYLELTIRGNGIWRLSFKGAPAPASAWQHIIHACHTLIHQFPPPTTEHAASTPPSEDAAADQPIDPHEALIAQALRLRYLGAHTTAVLDAEHNPIGYARISTLWWLKLEHPYWKRGQLLVSVATFPAYLAQTDQCLACLITVPHPFAPTESAYIPYRYVLLPSRAGRVQTAQRFVELNPAADPVTTLLSDINAMQPLVPRLSHEERQWHDEAQPAGYPIPPLQVTVYTPHGTQYIRYPGGSHPSPVWKNLFSAYLQTVTLLRQAYADPALESFFRSGYYYL